MRKRLRIYLGLIGATVILMVVMPSFLPSYWVTVLTEMLIYGLFAMGVDIINGYSGLPSLGHAAFFGTGAYTMGISLVRLGQGQLNSLLLAIAATVVVAAIFGLVVLRARGIFFLFIMAGMAQSLWAIAWKWISVTGGNDGLVGITRPNLGLSWWDLSSAGGFYYLVLLVFAVSFAVLLLVTRSPLGHSLVGIRESESRMKTLGYNVFLHTYLGLIISGAFTGLAGALFAWYNMFVSPGQLSVVLSTEGLLMVTLGGGGTLWGAFLGGAIITLLKHVTSLLLPSHWMIVLGVIYIAAIIYMPQGISGMIRRRWRL